MRNHLPVTRAAAGLLGGAVLAYSGLAAAAPTCPADDDPTVVRLIGSSAFAPAIVALQNVLDSHYGAGTITIAYQAPGSCQGIQGLLEGLKDNHPLKIVSGGALVACTANSGQTFSYVPDIAISDVYPATCTAGYDTTLPAVGSSTNTKDFLGPVQAMAFVQPSGAMKQQSISANAAYMVFSGNGPSLGTTSGSGDPVPNSPLFPWTSLSDVVVRAKDSGTLQMLGVAIGLPGTSWVQNAPAVNVGSAGSGGIVSSLGTVSASSQANTEAAIGILSTSFYSGSSAVKPLAFQGKDQECAYFPSSTANTTDLINVRQGRYNVWGPEHLVSKVDGTGNPIANNASASSALVADVIAVATATSQTPVAASLDGGAPATGFTEQEISQIIDVLSPPGTGFIPTCAMEVSRTAEIGPESSVNIPAPCICRYESGDPTKAGGGAGRPSNKTCQSCNTDADCADAGPATHCHFNYCEVQ